MKAKIAALLAKEESSYGVDPTPTTAANAIQVISDLVITPTGNLHTRDVYGETLSPAAPLLGQQWYEISFVVEMRGSGTAGTAPRMGDLFEACGMTENIAVSTSVNYNLNSSSQKSCTIYAYLGEGTGLRFIFSGCRGTFRIVCVSGETAKVEFRFMGKYASPTDQTAPSSVTYDSTTPPKCKGVTFTFDSYAAVVQQLEVDCNNTIAKRDSITDSTGVQGFEITNRDPKGSMNPEAVVSGTYAFFSAWNDSASKALSAVIGSTAGNIITISGTAAVIETIGFGDRDGVRTFEIPFKLARSTVNDEFALKFT